MPLKSVPSWSCLASSAPLAGCLPVIDPLCPGAALDELDRDVELDEVDEELELELDRDVELDDVELDDVDDELELDEEPSAAAAVTAPMFPVSPDAPT